MSPSPNRTPDPRSGHARPTRRQLFHDAGASLGGLAMWSMLGRAGFFSGADQNPLAPRPQHFPAKAKHVIFLFMFGGPSQMDLFDYKPALQKYSGKSIDIERRRNKVQQATLLGCHGLHSAYRNLS